MGSKERHFAYITALHPEVTGSALPVSVTTSSVRKCNFLVDCGLFQEREYNYLNQNGFPFSCEKIEFVLITHNHADHVGKLPLLCKNGFYGKIFATKATAKLMKISLSNSYQIMKEEAQRWKQKPLYDEEDLERVFECIEPCEIGESIQVNQNVKVTFFDNGHIVGASMILTQLSYPGEKDINILFTGDYKPYNTFKKVKAMPAWVYELPMNVVIESTYGDTETSEIEYNFERDVEKLLKERRSLFIPVLAQGRAQEILYILKNMQEDGRIDGSIPIYLDGDLVHQYTYMYRSKLLDIDEEKLDFLPKNFRLVNKDNRVGIMMTNTQKIILTTSGMLDHGPAQLYLPTVITRKNWVIYLTSYCSEGTLGRKLMDNVDEESVMVMGMELKIKAQIFSTSQFSSHAKANELIALLSKFKNLKLVLINHGEKETKEKFASRVEDAEVAERVEILGQHTFKVASYGYMKAMGAKLYSNTKTRKNTNSKKVKKLKKVSKTRTERKRVACKRKISHPR